MATSSMDKASVLKRIKKDDKEPIEWSHVEIQRAKTAQITLPEGMSFDDAILWIKKKQKEEETDINFFREFQFHPHDGAVALAHVLKDLFGWQELVPQMTWFGKILPAMLSIKTGVNKHVTVPWGQMAIPGVEGLVQTQAKGGYNRETKVHEPELFILSGKIWQRDVPIMNFIGDQIEKWVAEHSIYRGKAIDSRREFLDLSKVNESDLIFGPDTMAQIDTSIFTPIDQTEVCREAGIPMKRGVLLEGPFGTGKTLTAYVTAKKAEANDWTFVYGHTEDEIPKVIHLARQYQPAVVFMEDIDTHIAGEGDASLLDIMDGILSKDAEVIVIYTTNKANSLPQALRRPGRLDAVIHVGHPEPEAIHKLIHKYGRGLVNDEEDISGAVKACKGMIPATIREMVERAKLAAIMRTKSTEFSITNEDLVTTIGMMRHQVAYMQEDAKEEKTIKLIAEVTTNKAGGVENIIAGPDLVKSDEKKPVAAAK
jgi:transitional endoplasmic reticulum ATPase